MADLLANVEAGKLARECWAFLCDEANTLGANARIRFWQHLRDCISPPVESKAEFQPMTEAQSRAFDTAVLPFGKFKGEHVDSVSLQYLVWLADAPDEFKDELRRYLKSERIQRELASEPTP